MGDYVGSLRPVNSKGAELVCNSAALSWFPSIQAAEFKNNSALPKQEARVRDWPSMPVHCLFPSVYWRAPPRESLTERFGNSIAMYGVPSSAWPDS